MRHELKTDPAVFAAVLAGTKTHEIRKNDRGFAVGDELLLRETESTGAEIAAGSPLIYTGRELTRTVTHVLTGYGLQDGWCILSLARAAIDKGARQAAPEAPAPDVAHLRSLLAEAWSYVKDGGGDTDAIDKALASTGAAPEAPASPWFDSAMDTGIIPSADTTASASAPTTTDTMRAPDNPELVQLRAQNMLLVDLYDSVAKLVKAKGRYHTEQNYVALVAAYDLVRATKETP